jgi:alkylation response protein AidB-like acyl-CoA dehydrogenase
MTSWSPGQKIWISGVERAPAANVIGQVDQGFAVLWDILNPERIVAAAGAVGCGELALKVAYDYARSARRSAGRSGPTRRSRSRSPRPGPRWSWHG